MNAPERIRWLDVGEMVTKLPPEIPWVADRVVPAGALTVIYAPGGDGKSLFAMALAAAIAHGESLAGIQCRKGVAVYLDGENGEHEIHRRVHTLGLPSHGVKVGDAGGLNLRQHLADVEEAVELERPDLLVLDSLRSLSPGLDENDTAQTAALLDGIRRLAHRADVAVLLIHHANKAGKDFRGASSIRDSVDVLWHMGRAEDDPDPQRRFLHNKKMRGAQDSEKRWLRLSVDRGRVLVDEAEPFDPEPAERAPVRKELSASCLAAMNGSPMKLAEIAVAVGRDPKDGSVRNAMKLLQRDGDVEKLPDGTWLKVQGATPPRGFAPLHPVEEADPAVEARAQASLECFLADALPAAKCACERPLLGRDEDGLDTCTLCSRAAA